MISEHKVINTVILLTLFVLLLLIPLVDLLLNHLKRFIRTLPLSGIFLINLRGGIDLPIEKTIDMPDLLAFLEMVVAMRLLFPVLQLPQLLVSLDKLVTLLSHDLIN